MIISGARKRVHILPSSKSLWGQQNILVWPTVQQAWNYRVKAATTEELGQAKVGLGTREIWLPYPRFVLSRFFITKEEFLLYQHILNSFSAWHVDASGMVSTLINNSKLANQIATLLLIVKKNKIQNNEIELSLRVLLISFRFISDSMLECSTMTRTVEQQTGEVQNPIPWKLLWRLGCRFSAKSYPQVIVPWIRQVVNINFFLMFI